MKLIFNIKEQAFSREKHIEKRVNAHGKVWLPYREMRHK